MTGNAPQKLTTHAPNTHGRKGSRIMGKKFIKIGFFLAFGFLQVYTLVLVVSWAIGIFFIPVDDCDKDRWNRCGMHVVTDNKTGKQYLITSGGGIIERATK